MGTLRHHFTLGLAGIVLVASVVTHTPSAAADGGDMVGGRPQAATQRITAGDKHSCVITSDAPTAGGVFCWGNNALGQLGLGDTEHRGDQPGEMGDALPALDLGAPATSISAGAAHTCAVLSGGAVKCWGYNSSGQLGVGDTDTRGDQAGEMGGNLPAVALGTGRTAVAVASGVEFSCALLDNGSVKCWGDNAAGQLGQGDTADRGDQAGEMGDALPTVDLGTARTAIAITAGGAFACALLDTHAVKCWGNNDNGQLGRGDTANRGDQAGEMGDALLAVDLGAATTARAISAGRFHACALTTVRHVACWGDNAFGQLGLGDHLDRGDQAGEMGDALTGIELDIDDHYDGVVTTGFGTCVVGLAVTPHCFGQNSKGQFAIGHSNDTATWQFTDIAQSNAVAGGLEHLCWTRANGSVRCTGANDAGQLGQGDTTNRGGDLATTNPPAIVLRRSAVPSMVSAGDYHTCVLVDGGDVRCVGGNFWGELGQGDTIARGGDIDTNGDKVPLVDLGTGRTAVSIAAGDGNTCAILDNGSLKCWGRNESGVLGLGDTASRGDQPGEMGDNLPAIDLGTGRTAVEIGLGHWVTCARLDNGTVKCWGYGVNGSVGQGDTATRGDEPGEMGDNLPAIDLGTGRTAKDLAVGYNFVCALLDDNTVKCWGYYDWGQIGWTNNNYIGNNPGEMGDNLAPLNLGTGRSALQIDAYDTVCAVLDNHTVKCWGHNEWAEAGHGDLLPWGNNAAHWGDNLPTVSLGSGRTATSVSVGARSTCATLDNGTAKCWGDNGAGKLGIDDEVDHGDGIGAMGDGLPAVILGADTPTAISVGGSHACALLASSTVKCWGDNLKGQLGLATPTGAFGHIPGSMENLPHLDTGGSLNRVLPAITSPGFPDDVVATPGNAEASISWTAPDDGGSPITGYRVERSTDGGVHWTTAVANTASTATSLVVGGLTNGTAVRFRAAAINAVGAGAVSAPSAPVVPSTVPFAPATVTATAGDTTATVTWVAPKTGGAPITGYRIDRSTNNGATWVTAIANTGTAGTQAVVTGLANFVPVRFRVIALNLNGAGAPSAATAAVTPVTTAYWPLSPFRVADTRPGAKTGDGKGAGTGVLQANRVLTVQVAGRGGVPAGSKAAVLHVTVVAPSAAGAVSVYPCGTTRSLATTVRFNAGATVGNTAMAKLGTGGTVCVHTTATAHVVMDVSGAHPAGNAYAPVNPFRLADTRPGARTSDGKGAGTGLVKANAVLTVKVAGRAGVAASAKAAAVTVTVVSPSASGKVTVYPCGAARPAMPTLVFRAGVATANMAVTRIGTSGNVCVHSTVVTHVQFDVSGAFPTATGFTPVTPARIAAGATVTPAKSVLVVQVGGKAGVPSNARAAVLNITISKSPVAGSVTVYPCGATRPLAVNNSWSAGAIVTDATVAKLGANGTVCIYTTGAASIAVDVTGHQ